jgi:mannose-1-phosphate guanylyltransferase/phosphomannomutase
MRALLLAAGVGSRLGALTEHCPKPMIELGGRPILAANVELARRAGITDIVINLHHQARVVTDYFGDGSEFGVRVSWSVEPRLRGTGGALDQARDLLAGEAVLVLYADNLFTGSLLPLVEAHDRTASTATVARLWRENVRHSGELIFDADGVVSELREKQGPDRSGWVNAGVVIAEPALFDYVPEGRDSDLAGDVLPAMLAGGERVRTEPFPGEVRWIDTPEDLERVRQGVVNR